MTALTLADFLRARIANDERAARALAEHDRRPVLSLAITVNHPDRLLVECEAKRRIVDLHAPFHVRTANDGLNWDYRGCGECSQPDGVADGETWWPCTTLRLLALPYASHPDYDERWRP